MVPQPKSPIAQFDPTRLGNSPTENIPNYILRSLDQKDVETIPYAISFAFYRIDLCEIRLLQQAQARKSLETLRNAGKCRNRQELIDSNIRLESVPNEGDYKKYFTKLITPDVVLYHCNIGEKQRMFFFIGDVDKTINVVALRNTHDREHNKGY
jgi:hypothetical protein